MTRECPACGAILPAFRVPYCSECHVALDEPAGKSPVHRTQMESVATLREQARGGSAVASAETSPKPMEEASFRPTQRPPTTILCILDDGQDSGELIRLRQSRYVIGRTAGDILIAHDGLISGEHLELLRQQAAGGWRWLARDLGSTNGTFVRVAKAHLSKDQEFLLGAKRYRFEPPTGDPINEDDFKATRSWHNASTADVSALFPALIEIQPSGDEIRWPIKRTDAWIGSDPQRAQFVIADDPLIVAQHARLARDPQGRWHLQAGKSKNGIWLRIREVVIDGVAEIQIGEQRLTIKVQG